MLLNSVVTLIGIQHSLNKGLYPIKTGNQWETNSDIPRFNTLLPYQIEILVR